MALGGNRDSLGSRPRAGGAAFAKLKRSEPVPKELAEINVAADTYQVSAESLLLVAELHGALALCLHDEGRGVGGLLHLRFIGGTDRPSDISDSTLSSLLDVLDHFKRAVLGNAQRRNDIQARILAHALPPTDWSEPSASLVDLLRADLVDGKIACGTRTLRRVEPVRVCFQPFEGRVWISGPCDLRAPTRGCRATS